MRTLEGRWAIHEEAGAKWKLMLDIEGETVRCTAF